MVFKKILNWYSNKKLIRKLWRIKKHGKFVDYKSENIFTKQELNELKKESV